MAHGVRPDFRGRALWDIIAGNPALAAVVDGRQLHDRFVAAANNGGGWVAYKWLNLDGESIYLKIAYIVKIRRSGHELYLGVGLGDNSWKVHGEAINSLLPSADLGGGLSRWLSGCSPDYRHPCSEDWAVHVIGQAMSAVLTADSHQQMMVALAGLPSPQTAMGFALYVHNSTSVLHDGLLGPSAVLLPTEQWLLDVGLPSSWVCPDPTGN